MERLIGFWQHMPEHMSPNLFEIGGFQLRYYSLMYIVAFLLSYVLLHYRIKTEKYEYPIQTLQDFLFWAILGIILGGRLGYAFFYNFSYYLQHPLEIILPFDFSNGIHYVGISGMSYHGGFIGVLVASFFFCRSNKISILRFGDFIIPAIPLGYTFGRLGNFINGELYGRATTVPWGMYFPLDPTHQLRHPSQLYESFFEGIVLFLFLWLSRKKKYFDGFFISVYIIGYGLVRFIIEFYREPDIQLGYILGPFSMGQILCFIMILCGTSLFIYCKSHFPAKPIPENAGANRNRKRNKK